MFMGAGNHARAGHFTPYKFFMGRIFMDNIPIKTMKIGPPIENSSLRTYMQCHA